MSVITPKNKLSQKEYYASHSLKELAKNSLYISLMFGQVLWPMNSAMAAPVFIPDDGVEQTGSNEYTVTANRAIARWQSFVLDETETIKFLNQDGIENSILLNLVTSEIGSKIAGELNANNIQFILVDPSGINIAGSAKIDVSGLVLSTAGVSVPAQGDFKDNPNLLFGSPSNGKIIIDSGATLVPSNLENVVLIGKDIQNDANIKASGLVAMLATDNATLTLEGSNILGVSFNAESLVDASLVNNGAIVADKAFLANQATNGAIKIDQSITANKIVISGDKIELASSLNGTSPSTSNVNIGKGVTSTSESSQLSAVSELTIGSNSALSGFNDNQSAVKANAVNVKSEAYTKATITNNNKIILDGFSDISDVQSVSFTNNQNNGISTNSSALLTDTKNSLKTRGVTFSGISNANLGGEDLKGSSGNDTFIISNGGLQANNISITHLKNNTVDANGEATLSGADNNTWTITADKVLKEGGVSGVGGYVFTGLDQVAFAKDEAVLNGRGSDIFEFKDDGLLNNGLLEAASMSFKTAHLKQVNNTNKVVTHADAFLQSDNNAVVIQSLKTNGVIFTDVNTADLGGKLLTGSSATDSFVITSEGITANDIAVEDLNTMIDTKGNAELSGADKNTWTISDLKNLTASDGQKKEKTYTFTGLDQVAFAKDEAVLNGRGSDTFEFKDDGLLNDGLLEAASMNFETAHLKQVNNTHELITNADASLQSTNGGAIEKSLETHGIVFTGVNTAKLGGNTLIGSSATDSFEITSQGIKANGIAVEDLNTTINANGDAVLSGADDNTWTITADNTLKEGGVGSVGGYVFTGLDQVAFAKDEAVLNGRGSDTFTFKDDGLLNDGLLDAASMNFETAHLKQVNNTHELITNADASLQSTNGGAIEKSLKTNGVIFTGVNTADLGGKLLTGSSATDSFEITSQGIKANDIAVKNLNTKIKANGDAVLSGADNNTWTITADNTLKEGGVGSVGGYVFTGLGQVAFAKDEAVLNGRGSDTFEFQSGGLLEAASMNFETAHLKQVNNTHELITNADASLQSTNGGAIEKSLKTNGVIFTGVNTADLGGKLLTGSSATDSFVITSEGITANDIAVKNLNTTIKANGDAVLSGVDNNTWTITADKVLKEGGVGSVGGYVFTGLDQVAFAENAAVLNGRGSDTFEFQSGGLLEAASMSFETAHLKQVNNTNKVVTHADAFLQSDDNNAVVSKSLKTNGVIFTGVNTADLGGKLLTGSSATDSFEITSQGIKANGIAVEDLNTTIRANGKASLLGAEDDTWLLTGVSGELKSQATDGYTFTGLTEADLNNESLKGSSGSDRFNIINGDLQANNILITNLKNTTVNANGSAILSGAEDSIWLLTDSLGTLQYKATGGYTFTDLTAANLSNEGLKGSVEHNRFTVIGNKKLDAAGIEFTGVTSVVRSEEH